MNLAQATDTLQQQPDVVEWVALADSYLGVYRNNPKMFALPATHTLLQPIIDAFGDDEPGFVDWILTLRDRYNRKTDARYGDLNKLYRRLAVRIIQQQRRARNDTALDMARQRHGPAPDAATKQAWLARREGEWGSQRLAYLDSHRATASGGRLTRDETTRLLERFYRDLDATIAAGDVPPWDR